MDLPGSTPKATWRSLDGSGPRSWRSSRTGDSIRTPIRSARWSKIRASKSTVPMVVGGSQVIQARRVDLGSTDPQTWAESVDDLRRCVDWVRSAGGACLVVHPGGLSDPEEREGRRQALLRGLAALADHATGRGVTICVENMPPGVFPGSRMSELREVVDELDRVEVGLALDTGHAHISASVASETHSAGDRLRTTHVHDNNGRQDAHLPPGRGSIDWESWQAALDRINYRGPVVLECIRHLRDHPESLDGDFMDLMGRLCGKGR